MHLRVQMCGMWVNLRNPCQNAINDKSMKKSLLAMMLMTLAMVSNVLADIPDQYNWCGSVERSFSGQHHYGVYHGAPACQQAATIDFVVWTGDMVHPDGSVPPMHFILAGRFCDTYYPCAYHIPFGEALYGFKVMGSPGLLIKYDMTKSELEAALYKADIRYVG